MAKATYSRLDPKVVIVRRRGVEDEALVPAAELAGLTETAHLLQSPRNAKRLLTALRRAEQGKGRLMTLDKLKQATLLGAED